MILYHGTNNKHAIDSFNMSNAINGLGFYLTNSKEVASKYGKYVVGYDMDDDLYGVMDRMVVRPIDQRYTEDMELYRECVVGGMEYVITNQKDMNHLNLDICGE
jgi:hypothetical protein